MLLNPLDTLLYFWMWPIFDFLWLGSLLQILPSLIFGFINFKNRGWFPFEIQLEALGLLTLIIIVYPIVWPILNIVLAYSFAFTTFPEQLEYLKTGYTGAYVFEWYDPLFFVAILLGLYLFGPFWFAFLFIYFNYSYIAPYYVPTEETSPVLADSQV